MTGCVGVYEKHWRWRSALNPARGCATGAMRSGTCRERIPSSPTWGPAHRAGNISGEAGSRWPCPVSSGTSPRRCAIRSRFGRRPGHRVQGNADRNDERADPSNRGHAVVPDHRCDSAECQSIRCYLGGGRGREDAAAMRHAALGRPRVASSRHVIGPSSGTRAPAQSRNGRMGQKKTAAGIQSDRREISARSGFSPTQLSHRSGS